MIMHKNSWQKAACLTLLFVGSVVFLAANNNADAKAKQEPFKVGERLQDKSTSSVNAAVSYRKLNWDELMPSDWDPMKPLKGLNLSKMKDSDPRAMEALEQVRAAWNDSPIVPSLNGIRGEIPGFVVPLDTNYERAREFLLVPYFGACIHVPPPPSNQVIHVLISKKLTKNQKKILRDAMSTYGPISLSGTLETVSHNTAMGFASYRIKVDIIEAYQQPLKNSR